MCFHGAPPSSQAEAEAVLGPLSIALSPARPPRLSFPIHHLLRTPPKAERNARRRDGFSADPVHPNDNVAVLRRTVSKGALSQVPGGDVAPAPGGGRDGAQGRGGHDHPGRRCRNTGHRPRRRRRSAPGDWVTRATSRTELKLDYASSEVAEAMRVSGLSPAGRMNGDAELRCDPQHGELLRRRPRRWWSNRITREPAQAPSARGRRDQHHASRGDAPFAAAARITGGSAGYAKHPNVGAYLLVGLGCESARPRSNEKSTASCSSTARGMCPAAACRCSHPGARRRAEDDRGGAGGSRALLPEADRARRDRYQSARSSSA